MATSFLDCSFGAITPELILKTLLGCDATLGTTNLRVEIYDAVVTSPVTCAGKEDFMINLRKALNIGADGGLVIRINKTAYVDGRGVGSCDVCANGFTMEDYLNSLFGMDANGAVYVNIADITT